MFSGVKMEVIRNIIYNPGLESIKQRLYTTDYLIRLKKEQATGHYSNLNCIFVSNT